jgi:hypothetical protein
MTRQPAVITMCALLLALNTPRLAMAEDSLDSARDLYAAAAYDEALVMLGRLSGDGADARARTQIDLYRAFSLFALGRTDDARDALGDAIRRDPLGTAATDDLSPRVAAFVTDTTRKILPILIREKYSVGKSEVEAHDLSAAEADLALVHPLVAQARAIGVSDQTLNDLDLLADGFLALVSASKEKASAPAITETHETPAVIPERDPERIYVTTDRDVTPPATVRQQFPAPPPALARAIVNRRGVLEITIETDGTVSGARMREPLHPAYDTLVVEAAFTWKYRPARKDGLPVRFSKLIRVEVKPSE